MGTRIYKIILTGVKFLYLFSQSMDMGSIALGNLIFWHAIWFMLTLSFAAANKYSLSSVLILIMFMSLAGYDFYHNTKV